VLSRLEVAVGVDAALSAMREYFERAARELHARGGRILPKDGGPAPTLEQQMEALAAWHAFLATRLRIYTVHPCPFLPPDLALHACKPWLRSRIILSAHIAVPAKLRCVKGRCQQAEGLLTGRRANSRALPWCWWLRPTAQV
jgi:hypothetical protein